MQGWRDARPRVRAAADELCQYAFEAWHFGDSVGFEGLLAATDVLADARYEGFVHGAIKAWIPRAEPFGELDATAPGHAFCLAYERTGDGAILDAARRLAEFLVGRRTYRGVYVALERAPLREPYGGAQLSPSERDLLSDPGAGVFVDCLHFDAPFLTHLGRLTGDAALLDAGAAQARAMIELFQDPDTGVFSHFALERTGATYGYGWSRGQGWALHGMLDVLEYLPRGHADRGLVEQATVRLAGALVASQHESGHWPALVHEPDVYLESSAACFGAAGLARGVELGVLDASVLPAAERAWHAALGQLDGAGRLAGISAAVWACTDASHYRAVPTGFQVPWGQGPLLLAAKAMRMAPSDQFESEGEDRDRT